MRNLQFLNIKHAQVIKKHNVFETVGMNVTFTEGHF